MFNLIFWGLAALLVIVSLAVAAAREKKNRPLPLAQSDDSQDAFDGSDVTAESEEFVATEEAPGDAFGGDGFGTEDGGFGSSDFGPIDEDFK